MSASFRPAFFIIFTVFTCEFTHRNSNIKVAFQEI